MKVKIQIDTQTFVRFWLVVIGFAFAILAIYSARTPLILIGISFFLAVILNAPVTYLAKYLPGKSRIGGTAIAYVLVVLILAGFMFLVVPPIVQQTVKFAQTVPDLVETASAGLDGAGGLVERYNLEPQVDEAVNTVKDRAASWAANLGHLVVDGIGSLVSLVISTFLVLVLSFLMLIEGPAWLRRLWSVYNDKERMEHHRSLVERMYGVVKGYVTGQLAVSAIGGVASGLAVFVLSFMFNFPPNLALPAVAISFTLSLIPMFGATIAGVLISVILAFNDFTGAIIFAAFFIIYQQIENNFISPVIQSKTIHLSALTVLVGVTIGTYLFGLAGGIISIPIAGCIKVLIEDYLSHANRRRAKSDKPLARLAKKIQGNEA